MDKQLLLENDWQEEEINSLTEEKLNILKEFYTPLDLKKISSEIILKGINIFVTIRNGNKEKKNNSLQNFQKENSKDQIQSSSIEKATGQTKYLSISNSVLSLKEKVLYYNYIRKLKPQDKTIQQEFIKNNTEFNFQKKIWNAFNIKINRKEKLNLILQEKSFIGLKNEFLTTLKQIKKNPSQLEKILQKKANQQISPAHGKLFLKIIFSLSAKISVEVQMKVKSFFAKWKPESEQSIKKRIQEKIILFKEKLK